MITGSTNERPTFKDSRLAHGEYFASSVTYVRRPCRRRNCIRVNNAVIVGSNYSLQLDQRACNSCYGRSSVLLKMRMNSRYEPPTGMWVWKDIHVRTLLVWGLRTYSNAPEKHIIIKFQRMHVDCNSPSWNGQSLEVPKVWYRIIVQKMAD